MNNIAYSDEYQLHRKSYDYIFDDKYKREVNSKALCNGKYILETTCYEDNSQEKLKYNVNVSKTIVFDSKMHKISEFKNIDNGADFFFIIDHLDGNEYLFFHIDLYGYSVLNLVNSEVYHYIPEESFRQQEETFIWANAYYCKQNNLLAVDGCYWAAPYSTEIYDMSEPEKLPYNRVFNSYDMVDKIYTGCDVIALRWTEKGNIILECFENEDDLSPSEKEIDISQIK